MLGEAVKLPPDHLACESCRVAVPASEATTTTPALASLERSAPDPEVWGAARGGAGQAVGAMYGLTTMLTGVPLKVVVVTSLWVCVKTALNVEMLPWPSQIVA